MNDRYLDEAVGRHGLGQEGPDPHPYLPGLSRALLRAHAQTRGARGVRPVLPRLPVDPHLHDARAHRRRLGARRRAGELKAVSLDVALKPWRFFAAPRGATGCVEFRAGSFDPADRPAEIARPKKRK